VLPGAHSVDHYYGDPGPFGALPGARSEGSFRHQRGLDWTAASPGNTVRGVDDFSGDLGDRFAIGSSAAQAGRTENRIRRVAWPNASIRADRSAGLFQDTTRLDPVCHTRIRND